MKKHIEIYKKIVAMSLWKNCWTDEANPVRSYSEIIAPICANNIIDATVVRCITFCSNICVLSRKIRWYSVPIALITTAIQCSVMKSKFSLLVVLSAEISHEYFLSKELKLATKFLATLEAMLLKRDF